MSYIRNSILDGRRQVSGNRLMFALMSTIPIDNVEEGEGGDASAKREIPTSLHTNA